ncbi:MAG: heparinase II/III family protein [Armatimonadetes bacterium]|nr:heparinase II/III family protein [Armatimonadota bacterium]
MDPNIMNFEIHLPCRLLPIALCLLGMLASQLTAHGDPPAATKRARSLTTDAEVAQIRRNIAEYPKAKEIADKIIKAADEWVSRSDRYIWDFIPTPEVPRAFNSSFEGCPVHGMEYFKHGNYSWIMDPFGNPWKIKCPVGGEEYPSNDFLAFYKSGMKDRSLLTGDYADDGWGWRKEGAEKKHWFVAYYCHWLWSNYILPGVENLSFAYLYTGDEKYARKALVMLDRIAAIYPAMDHNKQSRYAQEFAPAYRGKIINMIWETGTISKLTTAYDNVFEAVAKEGAWEGSDSPLAGRTYADIRANIETNLLREGVRCIYGGDIRGNYGMHQQALLKLAIVLQDDEVTKRAVDYILNNAEGNTGVEGFNYALDNFIFREGVSFEVAPGYCLGWSSHLSSVAELLQRLGVDIYSQRKFRRMYTAYFDIQVLGINTPAIGDSGGLNLRVSNPSTYMARLGLDAFGDPIFAKFLLDRGIFGEKTFGNSGDLRFPALDEATLRRKASVADGGISGTRNLGGYGLGILEHGTDRDGVGLALYYGPAEAGHAHYDRLAFELVGYGKKLIPDFGYPQFAAEHKDRPAWETHTLSHNTVSVDSSRQTTKHRGVLNFFAESPDVQVIDVSAPDAYSSAHEYRRMMMLIGGESEAPYVVDFFRVEGGRSHDYSLHGFDGKFTTQGIGLTDVQTKGTLAGEDVPYSYLYDDPELEKPGKTRSFHSYVGGSLSYLYNVQRGRPSGTWSATWTGADSGIHAIFPRQAMNEAVVADGRPPRRADHPESLKFVLLRNSGEDLSSSFVSVLQPFRVRGGKGDDPLAVRTLKTDAESGGTLLEVKGDGGTDYVWAGGSTSSEVEAAGIGIVGRCAVIRLDADGSVKSVFLGDGTRIMHGMLSVEAEAGFVGTVESLDLGRNEITVSGGNASGLAEKTAIFRPGPTACNFRIDGAREKKGGLTLSLGDDTTRTGKLEITGIDDDGKFVTTSNILYFASGGLYEHAWLANEDHTVWRRVVAVEKGVVRLSGMSDLKAEFTDADGDGRITAYIYEIGPGEKITVPAVTWIGRDSKGKWTVQADSGVEASLPDGTKLRG